MVLTKAINLAPRGHLPRHLVVTWGAVTNGRLWLKAREGAKDGTTHKTKNVSVPNVHSAKAGKPGNTQEIRRPQLIGPVPGPISELYVHHLTSLPKNSMRIHHSFVEKGTGTEGKQAEKHHTSVSGGVKTQIQGRVGLQSPDRSCSPRPQVQPYRAKITHQGASGNYLRLHSIPGSALRPPNAEAT